MTSLGKESIQQEVDAFFDGRPLSVRLKEIGERITEIGQSIASLKSGENWASGLSNPDPIALDHATKRRDALEQTRVRLLLSLGGGQRPT